MVSLYGLEGLGDYGLEFTWTPKLCNIIALITAIKTIILHTFRVKVLNPKP